MLKDILTNYALKQCTHATYATTYVKSQNVDCEIAKIAEVAQLSKDSRTKIIELSTISSCWLLDDEDARQYEVSIWPPCSVKEVILAYPSVISICPIQSQPDRVIDSPIKLLNEMKIAGFEIKLVNEQLYIFDQNWIDEELFNLINNYQAEIVELLKGELN